MTLFLRARPTGGRPHARLPLPDARTNLQAPHRRVANFAYLNNCICWEAEALSGGAIAATLGASYRQ